MKRKDIVELMKDVFTSSEAAEYLNISTQRLNKMVHDKKIIPIKTAKSAMLFLKSDLDERKVSNVSINVELNNGFDINTSRAREAILYFTIQQYFNYNDRRTCEYIKKLEDEKVFNLHDRLGVNIVLLSSLLNTTDNEFYGRYTTVKKSFLKLDKDVVLVKKGDSSYPKHLSAIKEAPPYLFLKGNLNLLCEKSVCVVGSRNASSESMVKTERIAKSLIKRNIVVNAGLAKGIDTAAHNAALNNGGNTIAVIGTPINQYYPKENKDLQLKIEQNGLVVSQFPPCNSVNRWNFPMRNATMSGISIATIIMEAGETSGALKQADYALKQGRVVLIPQSAIDNPLIKWPKKYIERGAKPFRTLKEALQILNENEMLLNLFSSSDMEDVSDVEMD